MIVQRIVMACTVLGLMFTMTTAHAQKPHEELKKSMGWLVGKKWKGKGEAQGEFAVDKFTTQERFRWVCDKQCIEQRWMMKDGDGEVILSGLIIYAWDCGDKKIKSWGFGNQGSVSETVLVSCENDSLEWKGKSIALQDGFGGEFTYKQKSVNGEYHIEFRSDNLSAKQYLKAVTDAEFTFRNSTDSTPNEHVKNWGRYLAGGTWTTTMKGLRLEHTYRWILDKNFLYNPRLGELYGGLAIFGYDPASKHLTFWHFQTDGAVGQSRITKETDQIWKLEGGGSSPDGEFNWSSTLVRQGRQKLTEKDAKMTVAGETSTDPDAAWVKEPIKKK
jgi:hypothetical protein